jgi:hypothetical protein
MRNVTLPAKADIPISFNPWENTIGTIIVIIANLIQCFTGIPLLPQELSWDSCPCQECGIQERPQ